MSQWTHNEPDDPARELEEADWLIEKADALLRKHKHVAPDEPALDDDLPLLTDVIEDFHAPTPDTPFAAKPATAATHDATITPPTVAPRLVGDDPTVLLAERLVDIDTVLSREIENWFNTELPPLVERELQQCTQRIREQAIAHMRATLVPRLSESLAQRMADDDTLKMR